MSWWSKIFKPRFEVYGVCRHETVYAMCVMGEKYPVRATEGLWGTRQHSRAQAFIDGEWKWLHVDFPAVYIGAGDRQGNEEYRPTQFYKPMIWLSRCGWGLKGNE